MIEPTNRNCLKDRKALIAFSQLMLQLNIEAVLIEPTILYCLMRSGRKELLEIRGFNISEYSGSEEVVHFALMEENYKMPDKLTIMKDIASFGFRHVNETIKPNGSASHYFFETSEKIIHAVIFQRRADYFWSGKLHSVPADSGLKIDQLLFCEDSAFDRFSIQLLKTQESEILQMPADPALFLQQLRSSKFLECDLKRAQLIKETQSKQAKDLRAAFTNALKELKSHLQPLLIDIFLLGGTFLGWYRQCDIIPYTTDVDFATWGMDAGEAEFWYDTFRDHAPLRLILSMGLPEEAYELRFVSLGMQVDLFFIYEENGTFWTSGHQLEQGYYLKYFYPPFTICSGDLLGYRVLVPCEPEKLILIEYGPEWKKPVSKWSYQSSPKNVQPSRTYFPKTIRNKTFIRF